MVALAAFLVHDSEDAGKKVIRFFKHS